MRPHAWRSRHSFANRWSTAEAATPRPMLVPFHTAGTTSPPPASCSALRACRARPSTPSSVRPCWAWPPSARTARRRTSRRCVRPPTWPPVHACLALCACALVLEGCVRCHAPVAKVAPHMSVPLNPPHLTDRTDRTDRALPLPIPRSLIPPGVGPPAGGQRRRLCDPEARGCLAGHAPGPAGTVCAHRLR